MEIEELYNKLVSAYASQNLNTITGKLIELYKNKNHSKIREIANSISEYVQIDDKKNAKCFSKLMMLYHPDKAEQFRKEINKLYKQNNPQELKKYGHIFLMADIDNIVVTKESLERIDYKAEYAWDASTTDGFDFIEYDKKEEESNDDDETQTFDYEKSFYNLIKIREYGKIDVEFPPYYLEDFEEYEMAYSGLETLDGIEYCKHIKILDVSNNDISNLENLWNLRHLEELYLANNEIGYIDALSNLNNLKVIDLSENQIDDIMPLLALENMEFVNLIGNPVQQDQIELLEAKGIIVTT